MSKNTSRKVAVGAAIGLFAGFMAGILTAPKSGKETRGDIKRSATKVYSTAEKKLKKLTVELNAAIDRAKAKLGSLNEELSEDLAAAIFRAKRAQKIARETISAIKHGEADEPDLEMAVNEADSALESLNDHLEK